MAKTEVDYLAELVAFPSITSDLATCRKCAEHCAEIFKNRGLKAEILEYNGHPSVVATTKGTKNPKVLLQAHMDVVPGTPDVFKLAKKDGKLWGRGTFDMKFAAACYMKLLDDLSDDLNNYDFGIMLTFDEEIGGKNGVRALLDDGYSADVCILPDSGKDWHLETTAHGGWWVRIKKEGKNAHGSEPEKGVNAAIGIAEDVQKIVKLAEQYDPEDLTISLTGLTSGKAINQIPGTAEATFDVRFRHAKLRDDIEQKFKNLCSENGLMVETIEDVSPTDVKLDNPYISSFVSIAEEVLGQKIEICHGKGATDGRFFCDKNIPCVIFQPHGGGRHSENEWIREEDVAKLTTMLFKYISQNAKV